MEQTFHIGLNVCGWYLILISDNGYEQKETVYEDNVAGFVQCLKALGYKEI